MEIRVGQTKRAKWAKSSEQSGPSQVVKAKEVKPALTNKDRAGLPAESKMRVRLLPEMRAGEPKPRKQ